MAKHSLFPLAAGMTLGCLAGLAQGEVQSLSQDEMLETYIQDSAIIVAPRQPVQRDKRDITLVEDTESRAEATGGPDRRAVLEALIRPGEALAREAESLTVESGLRNRRLESLQQARSMAEQELHRQQQRFAEGRLRGEPPMLMTQIPPQPVFGGRSVEVPEAPFHKRLLNDQLELAFDGQTLQFGIGQPAGVSQINLPHGIHEGPVTLIPRPGGGFDLSIDVPD
ncbi:MAG: hypothetical protein R3296_06745 [Oleiphilaceae bacterium]|nr:hypothetical protein [Oleiphilaceae bacterium]